MSVLGLKAGRDYSMRTVAEASNGTKMYGRVQTVSIEPPPEELPQFTVSCPEPSSDAPDGFILTSTLGVDNGWAVIVDRDGDPVWFHKADGALSITTTVVGRDKKSILHSQYDVQQRTDLGGTVRINLADPEPKLTATRLAHHDFVELPDDRLGWIQLELGEAFIDGEKVPIASDRIVEMDEGNSASRLSFLVSWMTITNPTPHVITSTQTPLEPEPMTGLTPIPSCTMARTMPTF